MAVIAGTRRMPRPKFDHGNSTGEAKTVRRNERMRMGRGEDMKSIVENTAMSRRGFLGLAGALSAAAALAPGLVESASVPSEARPKNADEALTKLMAGNARYVSGNMRLRAFAPTRAALAMKQKPFAIILGCADSRVAPELAFDQGRGDLFVVRVAGNFINEDGLASIEYAVKFLGSPLIMVLGHTACGAVDAAIKVLKDNVQLPGHLPQLVAMIKPAVAMAKTESGNLLNNSIRKNVELNVAKMKSSGPIVAEYVAQGRVKVVGGIYDLETGKVSLTS
jgi:carbonic anhydrase